MSAEFFKFWVFRRHKKIQQIFFSYHVLLTVEFSWDENNSPSCDFPPEMFSNWLNSQEIGPFVSTADDDDDDLEFGVNFHILSTFKCLPLTSNILRRRIKITASCGRIQKAFFNNDLFLSSPCTNLFNTFSVWQRVALSMHSGVKTLMLKTKEYYYGLAQSKGQTKEYFKWPVWLDGFLRRTLQTSFAPQEYKTH